MPDAVGEIGKRLAALAAGLMLALAASSALAELDPEARDALTAAETAIEKAASVDGEWRETAKLLKKAKAAAQKGEYADARALAEQARQQAELGYSQSIQQRFAGPRF